MKALNKRSVILAVSFVLILTALSQFNLPIASADVGEAPDPGGLITPGNKIDGIEMKAEKVVFEVKKNDDGTFNENTSCYAYVTADFVMKNLTDQKITKKLFFPFHLNGEVEWLETVAQAKNTKVTINQKEVDTSYEQFVLPREQSFEVVAGIFDADFSPNSETDIRVEYDLRAVNEPKSFVVSFEYLMETGSHWAGAIGSGEIIFDFWRDLDSTIVFFDTSGSDFKVSGTLGIETDIDEIFEIENGDLVWNFTDLEPDETHNIKISFVPKNIDIWAERPIYIKNIQDSISEREIYLPAGVRTGEVFPGGEMAEINPINLLGKGSGWLIEQKENVFNEWVKFKFNGIYKIKQLKIKTGVLQTTWEVEHFYDTFKRPKTMTIVFSDGTFQKVVLNDTPNEFQKVELLDNPTSSVKFLFQDAYSGVGDGNDYFGVGKIEFAGVEKIAEIAENEEEEEEEEEEKKEEINEIISVQKEEDNNKKIISTQENEENEENENEEYILSSLIFPVAGILVVGIIVIIFLGRMAKRKSENFEKSSSLSMPKFVLSIILIICAGTVFGFLGYTITRDKEIEQTTMEVVEVEVENENEEITNYDAINETDGWEIYKNEKYGFEFKYPPNAKTEIAEDALFNTYFKLHNLFVEESMGCFSCNSIKHITVGNFKEQCVSNYAGQRDRSVVSLFNPCAGKDSSALNKQIDYLDRIENGDIDDEFINKLKDEEIRLEVLDETFSNLNAGRIRKISINGINGLEFYRRECCDMEAEEATYKVLLVKGNNIIIFDFHPVRCEEKDYLYEKFLKKYWNPRGFLHYIPKQIKEDDPRWNKFLDDYYNASDKENGFEEWDSDFAERMNLIKNIISTFRFTNNKENEEIINETMNEEENKKDDEISDWKTYQSEGWKYSIKYPPDFYIIPDAQGGKYPGDISTCPICDSGAMSLIISDMEKMGVQNIMSKEKIHVNVLTHKKGNDQSLFSYLEETTENKAEIFDVSLNGIEKFIIVSDENINPVSSFYASKGNYAYHIYGWSESCNNGNKEDCSLMDRIISTFEFTD
ncbi:MAG: hypothetical protein U9N04_00370 [Patescibacteria group bacterium]|nr:hypothetical protein [Patescibacteria group bacterium]